MKIKNKNKAHPKKSKDYRKVPYFSNALYKGKLTEAYPGAITLDKGTLRTEGGGKNPSMSTEKRTKIKIPFTKKNLITRHKKEYAGVDYGKDGKGPGKSKYTKQTTTKILNKKTSTKTKESSSPKKVGRKYSKMKKAYKKALENQKESKKKRIKKGYHRMPNGTLMKNEDM